MEVDKKLAKILVVDDDINQANATCESLMSMGYEVSAVFSAKDAEYLIRQQAFNIMLIDCLMPETDGYVLSQSVYDQFGSSVSIILMSGIFKAHSMNMGRIPIIESFIQKPADDNSLDVEIKKILKKRFYKQKKVSIYSLISNGVIPNKQIIEEVSKIENFKGGDFLLLLAYLMRSKSEGILHVSFENLAIKIHLFNGKILNFHESNEFIAIKEHLRKYKLISNKDIAILNKIKEDNKMLYLVSQGFISPHQYLSYIKNRMSFYFNNFGQKSALDITFKSYKTEQTSLDVLTNTSTVNVFDMRVHYTSLVDSLLKCVQENLSEAYLKNYLESVKEFQFCFSKLFELSTVSQEPVLEPLFNQKEKLKQFISVNQLTDILGDNNHTCRALYWALLQGFVQLDNNHVSSMLEDTYYERYSKMLHELKQMNAMQVFSYLGCFDLSDQTKLKTVYRQFIKYNHVDNFMRFGSRLCLIIEQINKIIIDAHSTISCEDSLKKYHKAQMIKESSNFIKLSSLKKELQNVFVRGEFDKATDLIDKFSQLVEDSSELQDELSMWQIILELKTNDLNIKDGRKLDLMAQVKQIDCSVEQEFLQLYTEGLLLMCGENWKQAQKCFDLSLESNSDFYLARMESVRLKSMKKKAGGLSALFTKASELKKSS